MQCSQTQDAEALLLAVGDLEGALHLMQAYKQFDRLLLLLDSVRQAATTN